MANKLDVAWKVLADPTASEEKWVKACAAVGEKKPPARFLRENSQLFHRERTTTRCAIEKKAGLLTRRSVSSAIDVACVSAIYATLLAPLTLLGHAFFNYPSYEYTIVEMLGVSGVLASLDQLFRYLTLAMPFIVTSSLQPFDVLSFGLVFASGWLYNAALPSSRLRGTVGQYMMGLTVVDNRGRQISFTRASGRYFATCISTLTFFLGYLLPIINRRSQSLHDVIAGCEVIRRSDQLSLIETRSHL